VLEQAIGSARIKRVAQGGATALAIYVAAAGIAASSQLLIARLIGAEAYGIYAYAIAWMTILGYVSALGFDIALLRFVPAYQTLGAWSLARGVIQYAERRALTVSFLLVLTGMFALLTWPRALSPDLRNTFLIGFALVPVLALLWIRCAIVRAFGGVMLALLPDKVARDSVLLMIVAMSVAVFRQPAGAPFAMTATLAGAIGGLGVASLAMRRLRPVEFAGIDAEYAAAHWRQTALPILFIGVAEALLNRTGVVLLGWFGETRDAGIYSLASNIALLAILPRAAINTLFAPTISRLFTSSDRMTLRALVAKAALWTLSAALLIAFVLAILAEPILSWFGKDFATGVPALRILLIGQVIAASCGSQLSVLTMTGHERGAAALLILSAIVNIAAGALFVSMFGLIGAAIATSMTLIVWNAATALYISRHLQLLPGVVGMLESVRVPELRLWQHGASRCKPPRAARPRG
jgi:O-antigen/teichoic acid export membrane protein